MKKKTEAISPTGGKIQYFSSTGIYEREKRRKDGCQANICMHISVPAVGKRENYPLISRKNICKPYISEKWVTFCIR